MRFSCGRATACLIIFAVLPIYPMAWSAPQKKEYEAEEKAIPKTPSTPPSLAPHTPTDSFRCQRYYQYQGQTISCDSNIRLDGEKLRPILQSLPQAVSELDIYQKNRLNIRSAAYIGTLGVVVMVAGSLLSNRYRDQGSPTDTSTTLRNVSLYGGGAILAGGFVYGLTSIQGNENHLENAVNIFNQAHPETPIQLQFSTGVSF